MSSVFLKNNHFWSMGSSFFLFMLLFFSENSVATDSITRSQGISVGQTLVSSGETFELGFFSPGNSGKIYVGIRYNNISNQKLVWVANRESPLSVIDTGSSLIIGNDGNLIISDGKNITVWSTNIKSHSNSTVAVLSDQGELSLKDSVTGLILWDSFKYPCDTFVVGMAIGGNKKTGINYSLSSWKTDDDPSIGNFTFGLTTESPPQTFVWKNSKPYRRGGPWDGWKFIGLYTTDKGYSNGFIVTQDNQQGTAYLTYNAQSVFDVRLLILTPDGNVKMSEWNVDTSQGGVTWVASQVSCETYGYCGNFGFCDRIKTRTCHCLKGFVPKSKKEWKNGNFIGGCVRKTELLCEKNISALPSDKAKNDGFLKLREMKVPDHYVYLYNFNASGCLQQCLNNCSCVAYSYVEGIGCMVWVGDLIDIQQFSGFGADIFIRLAYSELAGHKKMVKHIIILITVFGAIFLVALILVLYKCKANRKAMRRRRIKQIDLSDRVDTPIGGLQGDIRKHLITQIDSSELPMFDFNTLAIATNNFSERNKLGAGGFGPVYWGRLEDGLQIAVKRLSSFSGQGAVEFKNEILLISKLQHRNLVRLLGFCIDGDEKLLVYEYLKNKSLDTFLFDGEKKVELNWSKRFGIIVGIARGLLYLHRDSCLRIIHRDLKAGNILLDDNMNPRISDFGLARAFHITQELTNTHRVVGTFGYISPEYAVGGLFSEKSDVFSFGVLVLEIISGIKVSSFSSGEEYLNLQGHVGLIKFLETLLPVLFLGQKELKLENQKCFSLSHLSFEDNSLNQKTDFSNITCTNANFLCAWQLWEQDKGLNLMDEHLSRSFSEIEFMRCLQIGLLCSQDQAKDRPTMSNVVLMLTSDAFIPRPKQPTLCQGLINTNFKINNLFSINDLSMSMVEGR